MTPPHDLTIRVHGAWNGWQSVDVALASLEDIHWHRPPGAPRALISGFIWCVGALVSLVPHACDGARPHRVRVCVLKRHVLPSVHGALACRADEQPADEFVEQRPDVPRRAG